MDKEMIECEELGER